MGKDVGFNHYLPSSHGEEARKGKKGFCVPLSLEKQHDDLRWVDLYLLHDPMKSGCTGKSSDWIHPQQ